MSHIPEPPEPGLTPFTFPDSGRTVFVRRVGPLLMATLRKQYPPPTPPLNRVDYGDGVVREEPNPADPDHQAALQEYNLQLEERARRLCVRRGIVVRLDDEAAAELAALREDAAAVGLELEGSDVELYVSYLCVQTEADYEALVSAVLRRSQPTEEAIQEAADSFRG